MKFFPETLRLSPEFKWNRRMTPSSTEMTTQVLLNATTFKVSPDFGADREPSFRRVEEDAVAATSVIEDLELDDRSGVGETTFGVGALFCPDETGGGVGGRAEVA